MEFAESRSERGIGLQKRGNLLWAVKNRRSRFLSRHGGIGMTGGWTFVPTGITCAL